jgi:hypothetical protein
MPASAKTTVLRWFAFLRHAALRTGIFAGVSLSLIFTAWLLAANRAPLLEPLALERNIAAAALVAVFASIPLLRFYSSPSELLISGLLAWSLLAVTYRMFCFKFDMLEQYYSAFQVFVVGAVSYLVFATVSWIGTIIWRVHATTNSHTRH